MVKGSIECSAINCLAPVFCGGVHWLWGSPSPTEPRGADSAVCKERNRANSSKVRVPFDCSHPLGQPVCEQPVVSGGREERGMEVAREGTLRQSQLLHLHCNRLIPLLWGTQGTDQDGLLSSECESSDDLVFTSDLANVDIHLALPRAYTRKGCSF